MVPQQPPTIDTPSSVTWRRWILGERLGCEVVVRAPVDDAGQAGVGQHADRQRRVLGQEAQVLLHLRRAGGAVDAEHVGSHRPERHEGGADLAADEHPPGRLHRHLDLQRHGPARRLHRPPAGDHRRLDLEEVHARLDEEQVDAAFEQPGGLLLVGVAQVGEADVPEARQLRAGTDRAGDVAGATVGGELVGDLSGEAAGGDVELVGLVGDVVLVEHRREAAEARRLDGIDADLEERRVHAADHVGPGEAEDLVAALQRLRRRSRRRTGRGPGCTSRTRRRTRRHVRRRHRGRAAVSSADNATGHPFLHLGKFRVTGASGEDSCQGLPRIFPRSRSAGRLAVDVNEDRFPRRRPRTAHQSEPRPQLVRSGTVLAPGRRSRRRGRPQRTERCRGDRRPGRGEGRRAASARRRPGDADRPRVRRQGRPDACRSRAGDGADLVAIGTGTGQLSIAELRDAAAAFARAVPKHAVLATSLHEAGGDAAAAAQAVVEGVVLARYRFESLKSDGERVQLQSLTLLSPRRPSSARSSAGIARGRTTLASRTARPRPRQLAAQSPHGDAVSPPSPPRSARRLGLDVEVFERRPPRRARLRRSARRQRRELRAAVHDQADLPPEAVGEAQRPPRPRRQGDHVRLRRHQPEAERPDARGDEDGHVRRRRRAGDDVSARPRSAAATR